MKKSMTNVAADLMQKKKKPITFEKLWAEVTQVLGLSEKECLERISQFYTNMMLDGRFVNLGDANWDLRTRHTFEKVHIDMNDIYSEEELEVEEVEEESEEEVHLEVEDDLSETSFFEGDSFNEIEN